MQERFRRAFLTVTKKAGIVEFARALDGLGIELFSAGNTKKVIAEGGVKITDLAEMPGAVGSMLDHGLLTLQPAAHGPLLTKRTDVHDSELRGARLPLSYDLVVVDPYDWKKAFDEYHEDVIDIETLREAIDVGGFALLCSATKRLKFPLVHELQRQWFLDWCRAGCPDFEFWRDKAISVAARLVACTHQDHMDFMHLWNLTKHGEYHPTVMYDGCPWLNLYHQVPS